MGIATALAVDPFSSFVMSQAFALDQTTQHQILQLLKNYKRKKFLTYLFISHDLNVLKKMTNRMGVPYSGSLIEFGETAALLTSPQHPYTKALVSSILTANPLIERSRTQVLIAGEPPSPLHPPKGCPFTVGVPRHKHFVELHRRYYILSHLLILLPAISRASLKTSV